MICYRARSAAGGGCTSPRCPTQVVLIATARSITLRVNKGIPIIRHSPDPFIIALPHQIRGVREYRRSLFDALFRRRRASHLGFPEATLELVQFVFRAATRMLTFGDSFGRRPESLNVEMDRFHRELFCTNYWKSAFLGARPA